MKVESIAQSVADVCLRFGEGADGEKAIMVFLVVLYHLKYADDDQVSALRCCIINSRMG